MPSTNKIAVKRMSYFDRVRPQLTPKEARRIRPHYEDRILVKKLPWPFTESEVIQTPETLAARKEGDQYGEVTAVGKGIRKFCFACECGAKQSRPAATREHAMREEMTFPNAPFCSTCQKDMVFKKMERYPFTVAKGDRVIYARCPSNEFEDGKNTFTFVYAEQSIFAVVD